MDYIVKNNYESIMYDAFNENGRIIKWSKLILSFLGVPIYIIDKIIYATNRSKRLLYILFLLVALVGCIYLLIYHLTHMLLIMVILLLEYYFRIHAIIQPF